ncbi:biotin/lipoyl-binding protein [Sinorhizobium arboris]|uniref:biotin/lipoyl-binding protein n=1 Tax=Sinorhizobium arboris TaxID=76745 RepID=UPI003B00E374
MAIFLLTANFSRREQAVGFLTAEPQISRINAPRPGRVQRVAVREGQAVKRGDVLMYIDWETHCRNRAGTPAGRGTRAAAPHRSDKRPGQCQRRGADRTRGCRGQADRCR